MIIILILFLVLHLFFLFNKEWLFLYTNEYIVLNIAIILFVIFLKIKLIKLKKHIDVSITEINKELLSRKITILKAPVNLHYIKEFIPAINKIILHLSQKNKTAQEFNSNVSHELKTPLTELKADLEYFLYYTPLNDEVTKKIKYFIKKINNLETITSQMLLVSNNNVEKLNNAMQRVFLNDIIYDALEEKKDLIKQKNLYIQTEISQAISFHGHKELLKHAVSNILDNAIKYSYEQENICIYLKTKKNYIYLIIKDNGIGISKKDIMFIFHPYYRGLNITSNIAGYGLGLSLASWIFELHNAKIKIKSTYNKGTTVLIKFYVS